MMELDASRIDRMSKSLAEQSKISIWLHRAAFVITLLIIVGAISYPLIHRFSPPLPETLPASPGNKITDNAEATSNAFLQAVFFLTTVSFGLAALATFASNKKTIYKHWLQPINAIVLSIMGYFLIRSTVYAYEACLAVVVQLDAGGIYLSRLNPLLDQQATSVYFIAAIAFVLAVLNQALESDEEIPSA